jgi:hypothetical protein
MDLIMKTALNQQLQAALDMLENALRACPEELWCARLWGEHSSRPELSEFWYIAYHMLFWLDLYLSGAVEGFTPPKPFSLGELDPAGLVPERVYTLGELQTYLDHCRMKVRAVTEALTDEKAGQVCRFAWGKLSFAALLLDSLRHVQDHAAQLNMLLGQKTGWEPGWVARAERS